MAEGPSPSKNDGSGNDLTDPRAARRAKLQKLVDCGVDPFGQRFDDRTWISDCHAMAGQVKFVTSDGKELPLPDFDAGDVDYRQWKTDNGPGEEVGPVVRVSGRIMLARPTGKLIFLNVKDWTGSLQVFVGKKQVGEDFELAKLFDLGDLVGAEGRLGRTNTGELTVFAEKLFFHTKMLEVPPEKHAGLTDPDLKQRMRYADMAFNDGVTETFLDRT
ncbi:MAG: OB-fold nucleic acid binding domain-containing protein, partial [Planctomycetota bacterium]